MATIEKTQTLVANYEAFERMLPRLLLEAPGQYALLRDQALVGTYQTAAEAQATGHRSFDDGLFSVQKIKEGAVSLGYFSYARYCRVA
ncbi:hypothetical protein SCH01S_42_01100 [Sphingomonas changbaiensis NBRC 104936]|uniref:Uncharacterized protein n=1 Tax=Sphingomonas changbaiensis NBRC 104936 TaxID=1219043 RepID=A0A0E9MQM4_9SPHN|nr:hypothetical protein [Sphingomonas changbaiensis]GAO40067.1 hypothetical protein SCH01S_42_01100 [Sphingomonas changbaiensis NBRC 104936]